MRYVITLILIPAILTIIVCSDKGINFSSDDAVVGEWIYNSTYCRGILNEAESFDSLEFNYNGKGVFYLTNSGINLYSDFAWTIWGNNLSITILTINGLPNELFTGRKTTYHYQRIDSALKLTTFINQTDSIDCISNWTLQR